MSLGVKAIDDDHKALIQMINDLFIAIETNSTQVELEHTFKKLEEYALMHFSKEEALMKVCENYDDTAHLKSHKEFRESIPLLKKKFLHAPSKDRAYETVEFLANWLIQHIINEDLPLSQNLPQKVKETTQSISCNLIAHISQNIPLHKRSVLLLLLPMLALLIISSILSFNTYMKYENLNKIEHTVNSLSIINTLINDLQKERGLSTAFIASGHRGFKDELSGQRDLSNEDIEACLISLNELHQHHETKAGIYLEHFKKEIKQIKRVRLKIDEGSWNTTQVLKYYTGLVKKLIQLVKNASSINTSDELSKVNTVLIPLFQLKENNGLLRANGVELLQKYDKHISESFRLRVLKDKIYFEEFKLIASNELVNRIQNIEKSEDSKIAKTITELLLDEKLNGLDAKRWFDAMSIKIDAYTEIITQIVEKVKKKAVLSKNESVSFIVILWISLFVMLIMTLYVSYLLHKSLVQPIENLTSAMKRLASGDKTFYYNEFKSDDIIGQMIEAFESFRLSLIRADLANVMLEIQEHKVNKYKEMSYLDPLTRLLNRRKFREVFEETLEETRKLGSPLCVLALDLDSFKKINDKYGHDVGDDVLVVFSKQVQKSIRPGDYFARVGGEEFFLLLPQTDKELALTIAKRIRLEIEELDLRYLHKELRLTVSIGISEYKKGYGVDRLLKEADEKLYESKNTGRNKVSD